MLPKKEYTTPNLVPGEASESDEDDVILTMMKNKSSNVGVIVAGEASESSENTETEEDSFSSAAEVYLNRIDESPKKENHEKIKYKSLLHKKLCDSNTSLQRELFNFLHKPLINAARKLNDSNQQLLGSQVQMQDATISMRQINSNLMKLDRAFETSLTVPFLPDIQIEPSK